MCLNVSTIQHFSVGDGAGIRTTVFLKGCNLHCPWCHNPETLSAAPQELHYPELNRVDCYGRQMSVEQVMTEIMADKDFYDESGGGATVSGGEAMLQAEEVAMLGARLKEEGVTLTIDTAGNVPYSAFEKVNPYVDEYLYDYKTGCPENFAKTVGGDLNLVTDNLRRLLADGKQVRVRIPLIPGFNTDPDSLSLICENLREIGAKTVDLLPFHRLGSSKYRAMGLTYTYSDTEPFPKEETERIRTQFEPYFTVSIE